MTPEEEARRVRMQDLVKNAQQSDQDDEFDIGLEDPPHVNGALVAAVLSLLLIAAVGIALIVLLIVRH